MLAIGSLLSIACVDLTPPWQKASATALGGAGGAAGEPEPGETLDGDVAVEDAPTAGAGGLGGGGGSAPDLGSGGAPSIDVAIPTGGTGGEAGAFGGAVAPTLDADMPDFGLGSGGASAGTGGSNRGGGGTISSGSGGVRRSGGSVGSGGRTGSGGVVASGGTSADARGDVTSASGGATGFSCANPVVPDNGSPAVSGLVTDFSDWNASTSTWGSASNLTGTLFTFVGGSATMNGAAVEGSPVGLHFTGTLGVRTYAGGGVLFSTCANVASFTRFQFTYYGGGRGCTLQVRIQVFSQSTAVDGCRQDGGTCWDFPSLDQIVDLSTAVPSTAPATATRPLSDFHRANNVAWSAADAAQVVAIQWQFGSGTTASDAGVSCTPDLTITSVRFLP